MKSVSGVLQVHYWQTENKVYKITNQTDRDRIVYVEHPRRDGWLLSDETKKPNDTQRQAYFFRVELKPHETVELPVNERRALMDSYNLTNLAESDVKLFINRQFVNDSIKSALENILRIKGDIAAVRVKLGAIETESKSISEDQDRLRDNIKALKDTAEAKPLIARYISKANDQETRIEQLEADRKTIEVKNEQLESELRNAINNLDINRSL